MKKNAAVAIELTADNSQFLKSQAAARAAVKALQQDLSKIKAPPLPDIAKTLGLNKRQIFYSPFGKEWDDGLKKGTARLKQELDKQAQLYREASRKALPEYSRVGLSSIGRVTAAGRPGQWDHLSGGMYAGGRMPSGSGGRGGGSLYGFGVGYNAIQDLVQGGPMAIANNIPQIIELVAKSPALKVLSVAAASAAAVAWAGMEIYNTYQTTGARWDDRVARRREEQQELSRARARTRANEKTIKEGKQAGEAEEERNKGYVMTVDSDVRRIERAGGERREELTLQQELRRARLEAINEPAKRAMEVAADEKRVLREKLTQERSVATEVARVATAELLKVEERLRAISGELKGFEGLSLRPDEIAKRDRLKGEQAGLFERANAARERAVGAQVNLSALTGAQSRLGLQDAIIDQRRNAQLGEIRKAQIGAIFDKLEEGLKKAADSVKEFYDKAGEARKRRLFDRIDSAMGTAGAFITDYANEDRRLKEQAKTRADMEEQLEIAEANAGGGSRRGRKLQREREDRQAVQRYRDAGYDEETAKKMAARERRVSDRNENPRRIRGAGASPREERGSALDYFDGKPMKSPETSRLDEYERRRGVPGVGSQADKELRKQEAEDAKKSQANADPTPKGDPRTHALLQELINAVKNRGASTAKTDAPAEE